MNTLVMLLYGLMGVEWRTIDYLSMIYTDFVYIVGILAIRAVIRREKENEERKS